MKKTLLTLLVLMFASSLCFAAGQQTTQGTKPVSKPVVVKNITGKVSSISLADSKKGTKSELSVTTENGQIVSFIVKPGASITAKGKAITLSEIQKDTKVSVGYTTKAGGINKAQSIKLEE